MSKKAFYITTTLPYVNAEPHIGHALEFIRADVIARCKKLQGFDVFFNTGTDEHGIKIYQKALQAHLEPQKFVDEAAKKFKDMLPLLGIMSEVNFIRTTDPHHVKAAQEFWRIADKNGLIYKKNYAIKYCVGCELEKTESELEEGKCPLHPLQEIEIIEEENYFFRFSIYGKQLMDLYERNNPSGFVIPNTRLNEIRAFVERGLEDFSISRLASKMPWGIPVPKDPAHVMYVWFDALVNYISAVGWPDDEKSFKKWWIDTGGVVQYCGKDNLRQQSAMLQAMLMAVGLPPSKTIVIDGFVTGEGGVKMSKSLGNTVDPLEIVKEYGTDALRYFVTRELHPFEDGVFTMEKFKEAYNAGLANGLGNLTSRIMKMAMDNIPMPKTSKNVSDESEFVKLDDPEFFEAINNYNLEKAMNIIWSKIAVLDQRIQKEQPFVLVKSDAEKGKKLIRELVQSLNEIAIHLLPFLPCTASKILECVRNNVMPDKPLFVRK